MYDEARAGTASPSMPSSNNGRGATIAKQSSQDAVLSGPRTSKLSNVKGPVQ